VFVTGGSQGIGSGAVKAYVGHYILSNAPMTEQEWIEARADLGQPLSARQRLWACALALLRDRYYLSCLFNRQYQANATASD
jgi:hypothetical protein